MPIDPQNERLLSLAEAARAVPPIDGKRPHISTVWRWIRKGSKGVRLSHARVGHRICTSEEALGRFFVDLAKADEHYERIEVSILDAALPPDLQIPKTEPRDV